MHFDMPDPGYINDHLIDFLRAQEGGRVAYQAAFAYPTMDHIADIRAPVYLLQLSSGSAGRAPRAAGENSRGHAA